MRDRKRSALGMTAVVGAMLLTVPPGAAEGNDWPQFRGLHRDGISGETGLLDSWPEGGPKELWRIDLGEGYSGIAVVGKRVFTMYAGDVDGTAMELAAAFDADSGELLWKTPIGEKYDTEFGNGPRATPTVDGDSVYVLGSRGDLAALSVDSGEPRWKISLTETFGSKMPRWGFSVSPLVDGDQLIVEGGGGEGKSYAALSTKTGEVKWTVGDGSPGYNSPLKVEVGGETRYVYVAGGKLNCIDESGNEIWHREWYQTGRQKEAHAIPVHVPPNRIFASGAEGVVSQLVEVDESGEQASVEQVWETRFMRNHFNASVLHDGHLYGFDNATLKAISIGDGKMAWGKRGLGKGSLVYADGKLFVLSDRGRLLLLEATPDGYKEKGSVQALEGRCWTAPTLSGGRLYLRDHEQLVVYDVKG